MSEILLSICIPTYNRKERIKKIITDLISVDIKEIEIVISDNASNDGTDKLIKEFKDSRIKYYRNQKNVGMDANFLLVIKRARGEFIFLLMDEDKVELKTIPWILKKIKENKNISQLCGSIGDQRPRYKGDYDAALKVIKDKPRKFEDILMQRYLFNKNYSRDDIRFKFEKKYYKCGHKSLKELLFHYPHGSGIVLRRKVLDLYSAKKYIGISFMHQVLIAQTLIKGDTLSTSKIFAYFGKEQFESRQDLFKGKQWWYPISQLNQTRFRVQLIYDITRGMKKVRNTRKLLLNKQIDFIYKNMLLLLFSKNTRNFAILSSDFRILNIFFNIIPLIKSFKSFLEGLILLLRMKKALKIFIGLINKTIRATTKLMKNFFLIFI